MRAGLALAHEEDDSSDESRVTIESSRNGFAVSALSAQIQKQR
jgi:hypothetical protein